MNGRRTGQVGIASALLIAAVAWAGEPSQGPSPETPSITPEQGMIELRLSGNRTFCVEWNEMDVKEGATKPRQYRNSSVITTFGYKYQISASRKGVGGGVVKLFESNPIRTVDLKEERPANQFPTPHLATPQDLKRAREPWQQRKVPRWIPGTTCTVILDSFDFPLDPGRYDMYLGFDLLLPNGRWAPLQSDFLTDVLVEKGKRTKVLGKVDNSGGVRTVELGSFESPQPLDLP